MRPEKEQPDRQEGNQENEQVCVQVCPSQDRAWEGRSETGPRRAMDVCPNSANRASLFVVSEKAGWGSRVG